MASYFEKDTTYYRADTDFGGCSTSGYLGENIEPKKLAQEIADFIKDSDAKNFEIVKHEARAGDKLAHAAGVVLHLARKNGKIIVID